MQNAALPQPNTPQYIEQLKTLPLIHASEFCKIATRIQDRLVESPLLTPSETSAYDAEILHWQEELPSILSNLNEACPPFLQRVRLVMKWRFQNIRIVLHRPVLLSTALRRCPFANLSAEEKVAIGKCRIIAAKTIEDISNECLPDLISGWNAVWFTFQACMVPLVSLFSDSSMPEEIEKWKASVETSLAFFERSKPWSIAAKRSMDAVQKLYQAYKMQGHAQSEQHLPPQPHFQHNNGMEISHFDYSGVPDVSGLNMNMPAWSNDPGAMQHLSGYWDDMMWDTNLPDMLETPFGLANDYDFQGAGQDSGAPCWMQGN
jgi:hypothetical protein